MKSLLNAWGLDGVPYLERTLQAAFRITVMLLLSWLAWRVATRLIGLVRLRLLTRSAAPDDIKRIQTMTQVSRYAVGVIVTLVTGMVILGELGISIAPLLATAGVAGIALGFGVQSLVKDYFTGFALLIENQLRQGDVVETGGKSGVVEEVTLRYIRLRDDDGVVHFIPNSLVTTVSNRTMGFGYAVMRIGVAYHANIDQAFQLMKDECSAMRADAAFGPHILEDIDIAGVDELGDSAVTLKARIKTVPQEQWRIRREFLRRIKASFDQNGIEIPFPHMTVYQGSAPARGGLAAKAGNG